MIAIVAAIVAGISVLVATRGYVLLRSDVASGYEEHLELTPSDQARRRLLTLFFDAAGRRFGPALQRALSDRQLTTIDNRLQLAGRPNGMTVEGFVGRKATFLVLYGVAGLLLLVRGQWLVATLLVLASWYSMDVWVLLAGHRRQAQVERALPDFLDVMAVTVSAGLSFRAALSRIAGTLGGPLGEEILMALHQLDLGESRRAAFEDLRSRNRSPSLSQFVTALLQAEELGAPLSSTLIELAADMRRASAQEARRRAARAAPQVSLVVAFVLMPAALMLMTVALYLGSDVDLGNVLP